MPGQGFRYSTSTKGLRTLRPGAAGSFGGEVTSDFFIYEAAQVIEVIQNEQSQRNDPNNQSATSNTGRIRVRIVSGDSDTGGDLQNLASAIKGLAKPVTEKIDEIAADPLIPHQTIFPIVGEYVLVFKMLSTYWYIGPINLKRKVTENAEKLKPNAQTQQALRGEAQRRVLNGITTTLNPNNIEQQAVKFEKLKVNPLKQYEGDVIYQGRYGNSIRFGSSKMTPAADEEIYPNVLIRAGQAAIPTISTDDVGGSSLTVENLNADASSIYLTANQPVQFSPATVSSNIYLASTFNKPVFDGAQIIINSDMVAINSKETSIYLFARKGVHINALDDGVTIDSGGSIFLRTPKDIEIFSEKNLGVKSKEDITISTRRDVNISGDRNITVYGNEIFLGGRSSQASPMVLGKPLKMFLYEMLRVMMSNPAMIGAGAPNPAYIARLLLLFTKYQILPDPFNPLFNSNDNFVMKTNERTMASDLPPTRGYTFTTGLGNTRQVQPVSYADGMRRT